jgi:predicted nucleic acid-binding protein
MILGDTSIWISHFKTANLDLVRALNADELVMHAFVLGELALGSLHSRRQTLLDLNTFEPAPVARHDDVMTMIEMRQLYSRGIGYVDAHLLASCLLSGNCKLLTRDRRLHDTAVLLCVAA